MASVDHGYFVGPDEDPDRYRLRRQVGGGGEAELWEADVAFAGERERVAVKILHTRHTAEFGRWRDRWAEQVELLQRIRHLGVVGVHGRFEGAPMHLAGQADVNARALYLVMNWVDGQDLRDWVVQHDRPEDRIEGLRHLVQVADILDWLHSGRALSTRPVVHGDLSPANVIINADGQAVLVDFGLFRIARHVTTTAAGTPGYSAPEVLSRGEYSAASDRYAFGGLTYYVLTGKHPPAAADELAEGLRRLAASMPQDGVTFELLASIFDPDPAQRPSAGEWIRSLRMQSSTAAVRTTTLRPPAPGTRSADAGPTTVADRRRLAGIWVALAVAAAFGAVVAVTVPAAWSSSRRGNQSTQTTGGTTAATATTAAAQAALLSASTSPGRTASPSSSPSAGPAASPRSVLLVNLQPETSDLLQGTWTIGVTKYPQSIACEDCSTGASAVYRTDGRYRRFKGTLDTVSRYGTELQVTMDGQQTVKRVATYGHPVDFDIPVDGVQEIQITIDTGNAFELVVLGQARLET
jgi:serine/threonine protein kinase